MASGSAPLRGACAAGAARSNLQQPAPSLSHCPPPVAGERVQDRQKGGPRMSTRDTYLAVFTSNKTSPRWQARFAMSKDEQRAQDEAGLAALKAWDEKHKDAIVYMGGPLGPPSARRRIAWRTSAMS